MSIISEKVSYLKGLAEGMKIDTEKNEGKLLTEIINVLAEIANDIEHLEDSQDELFDKVFDLEDDVDDLYSMEEEDFEDDGSFVMSCPNCEEEFYISEDDFENIDPIECPNCGQEIDDFEVDCDCDDCDC